LLQDRVYAVYALMVERRLEVGEPGSLREAGEELAALQSAPIAAPMFRLWLDLLAESRRDPSLRKLAAGFWRGNRELLSRLIAADFERRGVEPPLPAPALATAAIALDVGLSVQHQVDPLAAPLDLYPQLFEVLFAGLGEERSAA
jgi:hypothetical protein